MQSLNLPEPDRSKFGVPRGLQLALLATASSSSVTVKANATKLLVICKQQQAWTLMSQHTHITPSGNVRVCRFRAYQLLSRRNGSFVQHPDDDDEDNDRNKNR